MDVAVLESDSINLIVDGPNSPYTVDYTTSFEGSNFIVTYSISPLILGGVGEFIQLQLADISLFRSEHFIPISSPLTFKYTFGPTEPSAGTQSGGQGASYTFIFTILISLGISLLTGGSIELMWSLANTLQMLFFMALLELYYSSDLKAVFEFMKYSNFENPLTEYVVEFTVNTISFVQSPVSTQFKDLGFASTNILLNSFDKLFVIGMMVGVAVT